MTVALSVLVGLVAAAWAVLLCLTRVRRLHRLHIRVDAALAGLEAALARRASAAARAGVTTPAPRRPYPRQDARAGTAMPVPSSRRRTSDTEPRSAADPEAAANALSRALVGLDRAALPAALQAELADAEQLLVVARRVHNDAVRDTLGLRSRRLVRWLRLAGTAPMPAYFEIADPRPALTYDRVSPSQE